MKLPTLYKTTSTGKSQQWDIESRQHSDGTASWKVRHGQVDGKIQETFTNVDVGKNIGKANETSPYEQACSEAQSQWNKKKDRRGYSQTTSQEKRFRPMLAKSYNNPEVGLESLKDGKHIQFPCYVSAKLDGLRCNISKSGAYSRQGKKFETINHIEKILEPVFDKFRGFLDGELYVHSKGDNFQKIISAVKRDKANDLSSSIEYHIYDMHGDNMDFKDRYQWILDNIVECDIIKIVKAYEVCGQSELRDRYNEFIALGYEGSIVRNKLGLYKVDGRSKDLQKVKEFQEQEFPILDAYENKGKQAGQCTFVCELPDGTTFGVKPKGTAELREQYWRDWLNGIIKEGSLLTVSYFSMTTSDNPVPRFPIGKIIRDYENL